MAATDQILRDVLARLDALEHDNTQLKQDNAMLKVQNGALLARIERQPIPTDTTDEADGSPLERMSRRGVLRRGAQVAAASLAAGVLLQQDNQEARADHTDYFHRISAGVVDSYNSDGRVAISGGSTSATEPAILGYNPAGGPAVKGTSTGSSAAIVGDSTGVGGIGVSGYGESGVGVYGYSENGKGVLGQGLIGVHGTTEAGGYGAVYGEHTGQAGLPGYGVIGDGKGADHAGVLGRNPAGLGVIGSGLIGVKGMSSAPGYGAAYGVHTNSGYGVVGDGNGAKSAGVLGRNGGGHGVRGEGKAGVVGVSSFAGWEGVYGQHTGTGEGYGVVGDASGSSGAGMLGRHTTGTGVRGEGIKGVYGVGTVGVHGVSAVANSSALLGEAIGAATGVKATSQSGYGAILGGGRAQLRLLPRGTIGTPTTGTHQIGELYLDKVGSLFICIVTGTPGTWKKVTVS